MTTLPRLVTLAALLALPAHAVAAQESPATAAPAADVLSRWRELVALAPTGRVAEVRGLVLRPGAGELVLTQGRVHFLTRVGGHTVGAVFEGTGTFRFAPPEPAERTMIRRFAHDTVFSVTVRSAFLLFADSTARQLLRLPVTTAEPAGNVRGFARDVIGNLRGDHDGSFDPDVLAPMLNGDTAGFFFAQMVRDGGDPVRFEVNQARAEGAALYRPVSERDWGAKWAVVSRSALPDRPTERVWNYRRRLAVSRYRMDLRLSEQVRGGLAMAATATMSMVPIETVGPWLQFDMDSRLALDSARWGDGRPAAAFKADHDPTLWVRMPDGAARGDTLALTVDYHGDMIDRYDNFFYIDPAAAWYPGNAQGDDRAVFDVTFHSPAQYPLFAIGERVDSSRADRVVTTRWVTSEPVRMATFNLGLFRARQVENPGAPPLTVVISDDAHRLLASALASQGILLLGQRNMSEVVGADISNALQVFTGQYGEPPHGRYTVTEIPYPEGVSFPGLIDLSWGTFHNTSLDGFDQFFRAHETAHQWWGNAVQPATYRDAWLSEGLATYAGISYLQAVRHRNDDYYRFLDQYRGDILRHRDDAGIIAIGWRNGTADVPQGYDYTVYEKGAWVFHMLRAMMLDLSTLRAEQFNALLADYYQSFRGYAVTTNDFAAIAERHLGRPLGWFFDEWLNRSEIPTWHVAWRAEPADSGRFRVRLRVRQEQIAPDFQMPVIVAVDLGGNRTARFRVTVRGDQTEYLGPLLPAQPRRVVFNDFHSVLADVQDEGW